MAKNGNGKGVKVSQNWLEERGQLIVNIAIRYAKAYTFTYHKPIAQGTIKGTMAILFVVHNAGGCGLDLNALMCESDMDIIFDITGIIKNFDKDTKTLCGKFEPRCGWAKPATQSN